MSSPFPLGVTPVVGALTGGQCVSGEQTAGTAGQEQDFVCDLVGKQIVLPYANPENLVSGTNSATGTSNTQVLAAPGAGVRNYVTSLVVANTSASADGVQIKDGTTVLMTVSVPAGGTVVVPLPSPLRQTANTALNFAALSAATTVYVTAAGYTGR